MPTLAAVIPASWNHDLDHFLELCAHNPEAVVERTAEGELIIIAPTGGESGRRNSRLIQILDSWAMRDRSGVAFDSSTAFVLPNSAIRSPDAAWIRKERWQALTQEERDGFPPLCPDFVVEIRSPTDKLPGLIRKMQEYMQNGSRLGWLIDPMNKKAYIFRTNQSRESGWVDLLDGEDVLPGLQLDPRELD